MTDARQRPEGRAFAVIVIGGLAAITIVHFMHRCGDVRARSAPSVSLDSKHVHFTIFRDGRIRIDAIDGTRIYDAELVTDDDDGGHVVPLRDLVSDGPTKAHAADVTFAIDEHHDALDIAFVAPASTATADASAEPQGAGVRVALAGLAPAERREGRTVFLAGRGELGDLATEDGRFAIVSDPLHVLGVTADGNEMHVDIEPSHDGDAHGIAMRASTGFGESRESRITIAIASTTAGVWPVLFERAHVETKQVKGVVTGAPGVTQIVGLDDEGAPQIRIATNVAGRFDFRAPVTITSFYASASATRTSAPVMFTPGTAWDLKLDVSDGGELHVKTFDADTHAPLTARLVVHGLDGTLDPSFGPDYRASGAGPIIDALRGEITTPLPAGKYRVAATKGIEWSIDTRMVQIEPGVRVDVELAPRHVVPTPDDVGCDLHVHARPSFDAPVSPEDRVLSLVASGIDFAIPSEHNIVGNYAPSIKALGLEGELASVPGVEITTYMPKFGHFGLFPYPIEKPPPPYKNTDVTKIFSAAHAGDSKRALVVNHPRLTREIGFFTASGWKAGGPIPIAMRTDFDAIEIYNGYESNAIERVEIVLEDYYALLNAGHRYAATGSSDSHRIQYQWAGYPRTMARAHADDPLSVVAAIKAGHATVTSGPIIEFVLENVRPGGDVITSSSTTPRTVLGHLVVRAAPWVDVTSASVIVGGRVAQNFDVPSRPTTTGPEIGSLEDAAARTVRLDAEVRLQIGEGANPTWAIATARGTRRLDDILPFMPIQPFAFTNPIFIK